MLTNADRSAAQRSRKESRGTGVPPVRFGIGQEQLASEPHGRDARATTPRGKIVAAYDNFKRYWSNAILRYGGSVKMRPAQTRKSVAPPLPLGLIRDEIPEPTLHLL
jgi:hypothetical protein